MSFTLPTPVSLHTATALDNVGVIGSNMTLRTKTAGNLPITTSATRQQYDGNVSSTAEGVFYGTSGQTILGSIDIFLGNMLLIWSMQFNAPNRIQVDTLANGGVRFWLGSGTDPKNNYKEFFVGGNDTPFASSQAGPVTICIDLADNTNNNTIGSFDQTEISAYGIATVHDGIVGNQFGECFFQRSFLINTERASTSLPTFTGTSNFDEAVNLLQGTDYTNKIGSWITKSGSSFFIPCAFSIGNGNDLTNFNDAGVSVVSPATNTSKQENFRLTTDAMRVYLKARDNALDTVVLSGSYAWGTAAPWDFDISNASTCLLSGSFTGMGTFKLGSSVTATGIFTLATGQAVECTGADIDGITVAGALKIKTSAVTTFTNISATTLDFNTAGTYTLNDCTIGEVTNSSGGAVSIVNDGSTITTNTGPNITLLSPPKILTVQVNKTGADVVILAAGTTTVLASIDSNPNNNFAFTYTGAQTVDIGVIKQGFIVKYTYGYSLTGADQALPIALLIDRAYV